MADELNVSPTIGSLPDNWRIATLGSICEKIGTGATPRGGQEVYLRSRISHALIRSQHVFDRRFDEDGLAFITPQHALALRNAEVKPGDVLLNITGDGVTFGRACIAPDHILPACVNQHVAIIRTDRKQCIPGYLLAFLTHPATKDYIESFNSGGSRRAITKGHIESFEIPLPPLAEQKHIASILGALDDKIELNRRMNATLEAMARALFQSWFVDFDPVRAKLDGRPPAGLDPATAALFPASFQDSPLGPIPTDWIIQSLPEMIDFLEGPGLRNWQYRPTGMKFLNIRCITNGDLDVAKANSIDLAEFESSYQHFSLRENDVVISTSGTLGRIAILRTDHLPIMLNTSIIRMRGKNSVGMGFLWGFLQSEQFLSEMHAHAAGSVQLNFGPIHLRKISILRPTNAVLSKFEATVGPLLRKALELKKESRSLSLIRDALLATLLNP